MRSKLGESLSSVQKYDAPLEATTPSLEALKAYSLGLKIWHAKGATAGLPFYKRAVELDPTFAMPYVAMSNAYGATGETGRGVENARKAYELREKVSERERFEIEAAYYLNVTGELEKAAQAYELWQQAYPRDRQPYANLPFIYASLGSYEKTLEESREIPRRSPNNGTNYNNVGAALLYLNRLDEAETLYKQADERKLESEQLLAGSYSLAFLKGNMTRMAQVAAATTGKPGIEDFMLAAQADTEAWYGRLKNARELTRRAMYSAEHNDAKETSAAYQAAAALREVESGNWKEARSDADAAVKLAPNRDVREMAAVALARARDTASLTAIGNDYSFDVVFARQLEALGVAGDVAIGISTSGKSPNVLRAMQTARLKHLVSVGITGESGALLKSAVDYCLCVPSPVTPVIQELHIMIGHFLCEIVEAELFG